MSIVRSRVVFRIRHFARRLLIASDFPAEQDYLCDKQRFRNLHTYGYRIVASVKTQQGNVTVLISPVSAINALRQEICVPDTQSSILSIILLSRKGMRWTRIPSFPPPRATGFEAR